MTITEYSLESSSSQTSQASDEYWVLEVVLLDQLPITFLYPNEYHPQPLTRVPENFTTDKLMLLLESLHSQKLVEFMLYVRQEKDFTNSSIFLSYKEMKKRWEQEENRKNLWCYLSSDGGELWEKISHPRWDEYIEFYMSMTNLELSIESSNQALIERYLDNLSSAARIVPGSTKLEIEAPGNILYWKTLSAVYYCTVQYTAPKYDLLLPAQNRNWYTSPFSEIA